MFLDSRVETPVRFANIGRTTARTRKLVHDRILVRFGDRAFRRCKSASIRSLPVGDKLDMFIYESGDLA